MGLATGQIKEEIKYIKSYWWFVEASNITGSHVSGSTEVINEERMKKNEFEK